jgi:hypothetical protein
LVTQARLHLPGDARRPKVVVDQGVLEGTTLWWLDPQESTCVVPATTHLAVTAEARAQAAADEGLTVGRRVPTIRPGQGKRARTERLETAVVGMTGLTTDDQDGTPAHGREPPRRDCPPNPVNAVVVRKGRGKDDGPGGNTVFLTQAAVATPWQPVDDDDDRRRLEPCGLKAAKPPWALDHPPQQHARAVRVPVIFTRLLCALATANSSRVNSTCTRTARAVFCGGWPRSTVAWLL